MLLKTQIDQTETGYRATLVDVGELSCEGTTKIEAIQAVVKKLDAWREEWLLSKMRECFYGNLGICSECPIDTCVYRRNHED